MQISQTVHFYDLHPPLADFKAEVMQGLAQCPKGVPPKFFYDKKGSELFDAITHLSEYYPTRTEINILQQYGNEMVQLLGDDCLLVELGSGSSIKIRLLLDVLQPAAYMPMDISKDHLLESAQLLAQDYPDLVIHATCADYSHDFNLPEISSQLSKAAFFPGSSLGNFEPSEALKVLKRVANFLGHQGALLVGMDLKKSPDVLHAAYNDEQGITAAFNMNLLARVNRELAGDFSLEQFEHRAFYNPEVGRIEMHLVSLVAQTVQVDGQHFQFKAGETIHTENSYKYTVEEFHALAKQAGFYPQQVWTDAEQLFSVHCLRVMAS